MTHRQISFSGLNIDIRETANEVVYTFSGDVDENFRQQDLPRIKKAHIFFDLDNIKNFNSCGIREWVYLIKDFSALGQLVFRGCSVTMIDQINMVPDSLGTAQIESFFAPYYCTNHGEINQRIKVDEYEKLLEQKNAPNFTCPHCSSPLEFDALEESYFLFTDSGPKKAG